MTGCEYHMRILIGIQNKFYNSYRLYIKFLHYESTTANRNRKKWFSQSRYYRTIYIYLHKKVVISLTKSICGQ